MKYISIIASVALVSSVAVAKVSIDFNNAFSPGNPVFTTDGSSAVAYDDLFMVFWSSDQSVAGFNNADPTSPSGDELLGAYQMADDAFFAGNINIGSRDYYGENYGRGVDGLVGGYVYIAFFDMAYADYSGSVAAGTSYGLAPSSAFGALVDADPDSGPTPQPQEIFPDGSGPYQYVPEPASAMLGLFGVGVILYRRWRDRR
jgi:hypothetical protein